jgi:hypothetical protein
VTESSVYRCLRRTGPVEPDGRRRRKREWKRWERGRPNELWQMDTVGGFLNTCRRIRPPSGRSTYAAADDRPSWRR